MTNDKVHIFQNAFNEEKKDYLIFAGYIYSPGKSLFLENGKTVLSRTHRQCNRIYSTYGIAPTICGNELSGRYWIIEEN